jgi:hypothetical protein
MDVSTEPKIVMADSHTSSNVESLLARSVVDPSTTGDDAKNSTENSAVSGEINVSLPSSEKLSITTTAPSTNTDSNTENQRNNGSSAIGGAYVAHELVSFDICLPIGLECVTDISIEREY